MSYSSLPIVARCGASFSARGTHTPVPDGTCDDQGPEYIMHTSANLVFRCARVCRGGGEESPGVYHFDRTVPPDLHLLVLFHLPFRRSSPAAENLPSRRRSPFPVSGRVPLICRRLSLRVSIHRRAVFIIDYCM